MHDEPPKSIRKCFFKNTLFLRGPTQICMNPFLWSTQGRPKAMTEQNCLFFLPQRSSKLSTSTTTVQNECELKSAPICSPRRQFGAKLCEYVPLLSSWQNQECSLYSFSRSCPKTVSKTREGFPTSSTTLLRLQLSRTRDCVHRSRHVGFFFLFSFWRERCLPKVSWKE